MVDSVWVVGCLPYPARLRMLLRSLRNPSTGRSRTPPTRCCARQGSGFELATLHKVVEEVGVGF